jgi:condensin complex subunit 3
VQPEKVLDLVRHMLNQEAPEVQAAACEGVAKLMLAGMVSDESVSDLQVTRRAESDGRQILQSLVLLYFSPETEDNQALRQCLTYFLPVYCYTSIENQRRMLSVSF